MSRDGCVALSRDAMGLSAVCDCVLVFPDHTHLLFLVPVTCKSMCTKYWLTACSSLLRKICG